MAAVFNGIDNDSVEVRVEKETFICYKKNLEQCSDYFKAMFGSNMTESLTNKVTLHDISAAAFAVLVKYANTGEVSCDSGNVMSILESACILQFQSVIRHCEVYIIRHLSHNSCLSTMCFARNHGLQHLYTIAKKMALWYAFKVIPSEEIQCLTYEGLKDYLGHSVLNVDNEFAVLRGIELWVQQYHKDAREMADVFECLRLENVTSVQLSELMSHHLCKQCKDFTKKLETYMQCSERSNMKKAKRRLPETLCLLKNEGCQLMVRETGEIVSPKSHLCVIDVGNGDKKASVAELTTAPWEGRKSGPVGYRACVIGCCVYVFGGELSLGTGRWIDDVWEYHTLKDLWQSLCPLPSPRRHHSLAVHQKDIYICGGFGRHRILLNTVLKFSLSTGEFEALEPLPSTMYNCCSLVHHNKLYVFKSNILCLDLTNPSHWLTYDLPSQIDHHITSACMFQGKMYLGYCNDTGLLCEVNPGTLVCQLTGDFGAYRKACVQNVIYKENGKVEEELVLVGDQGITVVCEEGGTLRVQSRVDLQELENILEYCLLTVPDYSSV